MVGLPARKVAGKVMMASGGWKVIGEGERVVGRRATSKRAHRNAETGHWKKDNKRKGRYFFVKNKI